MESKVVGIIPLGGNATRMKGIPKFLLPCNLNTSLLDNTVNIFNKNNIHHIIAGVTNTNSIILGDNFKIDKLTLNTKTMSETCHKITTELDQSNTNYKSILIMPDTFFVIKNEIADMIEMLDEYDIVTIVWKIKDYQIGKVGQCKLNSDKTIADVIDKDPNCDYSHFWGVIGWKSNMNTHINPEWETIGNIIRKSVELNIKVGAIICESDYYDCGTYPEYFKMIEHVVLPKL